MSDVQKILVPDVGGDEVEVIEIGFAVGDMLEAEDGIVTVETDKASMDIPAPMAGELVALTVSVGDKIKEGDVIGEIRIVVKVAGETSSEAPAAEPAAAEAPATSAQTEAAAPQAEAPAPATGGSEVIDVAVPDIGQDGEVDVIDVLISVGDEVAAEDGLITLETDKATMDVPSPEAGIVKEVLVSTGDKVGQGSLVIKLETNSGAPAAITQPEAPKAEPAAAPES